MSAASGWPHMPSRITRHTGSPYCLLNLTGGVALCRILQGQTIRYPSVVSPSRSKKLTPFVPTPSPATNHHSEPPRPTLSLRHWHSQTRRGGCRRAMNSIPQTGLSSTIESREIQSWAEVWNINLIIRIIKLRSRYNQYIDVLTMFWWNLGGSLETL